MNGNTRQTLGNCGDLLGQVIITDNDLLFSTARKVVEDYPEWAISFTKEGQIWCGFMGAKYKHPNYLVFDYTASTRTTASPQELLMEALSCPIRQANV